MKLQPILKGIRQADQAYHLFDRGDHVAVALSGGKDSLLLALALSIYQKFDTTDFTLCAIHVDLGFDKSLTKELQAFCDQIGIPLEIVETRINAILHQPKHFKHGRMNCSLCANLKKGALFQRAKELGINKVAFGHHGDDALETLLLNMLYGARMKTFSPKIFLENQKITEIRPMITLSEKEIVKAARQNQLPILEKICPNDGLTQRQAVKDYLRGLEAFHDQAGHNMQKALLDSGLLEADLPEQKGMK